MGQFGRHHQTSVMALRGNAVLPVQDLGLREVRDRKSQRAKYHPLAGHIRRNTEPVAK